MWTNRPRHIGQVTDNKLLDFLQWMDELKLLRCLANLITVIKLLV